MHIQTSGTFPPEAFSGLLELWNTEYPVQLSFPDLPALQAYLVRLERVQHRLLWDDAQQLKGWYADFDRDGGRWFIIILSRSIQGQGWGSRLMSLAMEENAHLLGWITPHDAYRKADGSAYLSPRLFYEKVGFTVHPDISLEKGGIRSIQISWQRKP
ncbi:MAG: hypothetical protein AAFP92_31420 [Bacteroidota bacterium]